jgi:hypothetical protein
LTIARKCPQYWGCDEDHTEGKTNCLNL